MSEIISKKEIKDFVLNGFVRIDNAFSPDIASEALDILWSDLPCDRSDPSTWTQPVIRLGMYTQPPFIQSVNTPKLHDAFNRLIGFNKWAPCTSVGAFPVDKQPDDTGKHVDASFPGIDPTMEWRINVKSKGRALLMLILYSDVSINDAPTVIYKGSHIDIAKLLYPYGERGLSFMELANKLDELPQREEIYATGKAGTVYLCHPFLVHRAQAHKGNTPKFMAQPPLLFRNELTIENSLIDYTPVEQAIRLALG